MDEMNIRFKELRKTCHKTQMEFGKVIGISSSGVADIETGRRNVTEKHLIMLSNWHEYDVNIDWLRTGEGEMFLPKSQEEELAEFMADIMKEADATFRARFIKAVSRFNKDQWHALESVVMALYEQDLREKK